MTCVERPPGERDQRPGNLAHTGSIPFAVYACDSFFFFYFCLSKLGYSARFLSISVIVNAEDNQFFKICLPIESQADKLRFLNFLTQFKGCSEADRRITFANRNLQNCKPIAILLHLGFSESVYNKMAPSPVPLHGHSRGLLAPFHLPRSCSSPAQLVDSFSQHLRSGLGTS